MTGQERTVSDLRWRLPDWLGGHEVTVEREWFANGVPWVEALVMEQRATITLAKGHLIRPVEAPMPAEPKRGAVQVAHGVEAPQTWFCTLAGMWDSPESLAGPKTWENLVHYSRERNGADPVPLLTAEQHMAALLADAPELPHHEMSESGLYRADVTPIPSLGVVKINAGHANLDKLAARRFALALLKWSES